MNRFRFRLNSKRDADRTIIDWLQSLPARKRSRRVREVLYAHIMEEGGSAESRESNPASCRSRVTVNPARPAELDRLVDEMF